MSKYHDKTKEREQAHTATENEMGTLPIGTLLRKMSLPLIISMFVQVLYGLVDSLYVARLGDTALTAISLSMPIQYLVVGVGVGIGVGVNSVLSKKLGAADTDGVKKAAGNGLLMVWLATILFLLLGLFGVEPFYRLQTDLLDVVRMSSEYSRILCVVSFAALHQILFERLLSSTGKANLTMLSMFIGAVVNILLDPIMIFGWFGAPALGISGAAYATVLAQTVAAAVGLFLNLRCNHEVPLEQQGLAPDGRMMAEIIKIGVPVALSQCLISVIAFGMNNILLALSPVAPAIYVIYIRLQSFVIMPSSGMSTAGISIIAYNYGAKNGTRVLDTLKISLKANWIVAVLGTIVFLAAPQVLLAMFNASDAVYEIGVPALRIVAASLVLTTSTQILTGFLQALGKGTDSFLIAISQAVILLLSAWLLAQTGSAILVWLAFPIMELFRFVMGMLFVRKTHQTLIRPMVSI